MGIIQQNKRAKSTLFSVNKTQKRLFRKKKFSRHLRGGHLFDYEDGVIEHPFCKKVNWKTKSGFVFANFTDCLFSPRLD